MTVLMLGEVVARSVFSKSLTFSWEFSSYLMGAAFFLSAGYGLRTGGHVRVTLLSEAVPPTVSRALDFFSTVVGIVVTLYIAYAICDMTYNSYKARHRLVHPDRDALDYSRKGSLRWGRFSSSCRWWRVSFASCATSPRTSSREARISEPTNDPEAFRRFVLDRLLDDPALTTSDATAHRQILEVIAAIGPAVTENDELLEELREDREAARP